MPHSSGGGSHSSGSFHSSSSFSSHSSSTKRPPIKRRNEYFPHSRRYVYYRHDGPHYIYVDRDIRQQDNKLSLKSFIFLTIISVILIFISVMMFFSTKVTPSKVVTSDVPKIVDSANLIEDETSLNKSINEFYELTGIPVVVKTTNNEEWINNYGDIENYAYEQYLIELDEEGGWLILYSEPKEKADYNDWYWNGMQGNYTDDILTNSIVDEFNNNLNRELYRNNGFDVALISSLDLISQTCMNTRTDTEAYIGAIFFLVFGLIIMIATIASCIQQKKEEENRGYKDSELKEVKENEVLETCPFCGKEFFKGNFKKCPYCSGVLYQ